MAKLSHEEWKTEGGTPRSLCGIFGGWFASFYVKKKEIFDDILDPFVWLDKYEPSRREPGQFYSNAECIDRLGMHIVMVRWVMR